MVYIHYQLRYLLKSFRVFEEFIEFTPTTIMEPKITYIKVIAGEKRHRVEWKRCKNHDDVWSVIRASQSSGDRLFFPVSMGAASEFASRALASDFSGPAPGCVLWGQERAATKNTFRDKLRTDTFRFAHNIHDRNILFFTGFFPVLWLEFLFWSKFFCFICFGDVVCSSRTNMVLIYRSRDKKLCGTDTTNQMYY